MEQNNLYPIALSEDLSDEEILNYFVKAMLPEEIMNDLDTIVSVVRSPIAIRSSSLLEDSQYQPFAGIYSTYMIPFVKNNRVRMKEMLSDAIKSVYASVFYHNSKNYMTATKNLIDEEKMAVVLQEVCGKPYENHFYPTCSGVARSINFYPIYPEEPEDGVVNLVFGLGKYIVDGGKNLRFSPLYADRALQTSKLSLALNETQRTFFALNLDAKSFHPTVNDTANLLEYDTLQADKDGTLKLVCSTFDAESNRLSDGYHEGKLKLITFSHILKYNTFNLAEILDLILKIGSTEMGKPIEIEFAAELNSDKNEPKSFYILQIRPIVYSEDEFNIDLSEIKNEQTILSADKALGFGMMDNISDIIYVKPDTFDAAHTTKIAETIARLNEKFSAENKNYILIGPGRWGSSDPWLGIPIKWSHISAAALIVESSLKNYVIDPSQGTHFFQNLTSFGVGYFTINPYIGDGYFNVDFLNKKTAIFEDQFVRQVHFDAPLQIAIDNRKNKGVVMLTEGK